jgi:hypothetical protein
VELAALFGARKSEWLFGSIIAAHRFGALRARGIFDATSARLSRSEQE